MPITNREAIKVVTKYRSEVVDRLVIDKELRDSLTSGLENVIVRELSEKKTKISVRAELEKPGNRYIGDVCFYDGGSCYNIGTEQTYDSGGRLKTGIGKALVYLLEHVGESITEEEIRKVSGWKGCTYFNMNVLRNKFDRYSRCFGLDISRVKNPVYKLVMFK